MVVRQLGEAWVGGGGEGEGGEGAVAVAVAAVADRVDADVAVEQGEAVCKIEGGRKGKDLPFVGTSLQMFFLFFCF